MAQTNYREYLRGDIVKSKKYFYVLRPLLSCMWIEQKKVSPPIEFQLLLDGLNIDGVLRSDIDALLLRKKAGIELSAEPKIVSINTFILDYLEYFEKQVVAYDQHQKPDTNFLDSLFISFLRM